MAGVDQSDQLMAYIPLKRRSQKWWKKTFMHLFTLAVVNMHILHNKCRRTNNIKGMKLPDFITELGDTLTAAYLAETAAAAAAAPAPARPALTPSLQPSTAKRLSLADKHFPGEIEKNTDNSTGRKRCKVCSDIFRMHNPHSKKRSNKSTSVQCMQC